LSVIQWSVVSGQWSVVSNLEFRYQVLGEKGRMEN